jgi:8-oxo-dGTP pyrophosphatase MutT (NUDIX family)
MSGSFVVVDGIRWPVSGAQMAVVDGDRVLLQLRPWPPGWEMPGGHCEDGEDPATTAVREVEEETGLHVRLTGLVGVYTWDGLRSSGDVVFRAEIYGGRLRRSIEGLMARYVTVETIPRTAFPWMRQRVADALESAAGAAPVHRVQPVTVAHVAAFATAWLRTPLDRALRPRQ